DEQVREHIDDVDRLQSTRHPDGQALTGELVDDVEPAELASIVSTVLDKIVGPDVVWPLRSAPDARSVTQPQAAALGLSGGDFQPLASPDPLNPLVIDQPAGAARQRGDLAIAIAAIPPGQLDDVGGQPGFIVSALRDLALRRAMLAERGTGATLGN